MSLRILSQKIRKDRKFFLRCHLACRAFPASLPDADTSAPHNAGKPVSEVPVFFFETYQTYLNQNTLDALGITFPEDILKTANVFTDQPAA